MNFSDDVIWQVWAKAFQVTVSDAPMWRKDECGAWIRRPDYENQDSQYGWVIDHIVPKSEGGTDDLSNLRPLQWENTLRKEDGSLACPVVASSTENIRAETV